MGIKKHVTYESIKREKCYVLLREAFIVNYYPDIDLDYDMPKILGVFSTEEKAKDNLRKFLAKYNWVETTINSGSWQSKAYMDVYGNILNVSILEEEIDAEIDEISYNKLITLRNL